MRIPRGFSTCLLIALIAVASGSCSLASLPTLESPACTDARDSIKRFYSFHFGNTLAPSLEDLKKREQFVTSELFQKLAGRTENPEDYFTATSDYPKAFRVGGCSATTDDKVTFEVLLFWRDDQRSEQKAVNATLVRKGDKWLLDQVIAKN